MGAINPLEANHFNTESIRCEELRNLTINFAYERSSIVQT